MSPTECLALQGHVLAYALRQHFGWDARFFCEVWPVTDAVPPCTRSFVIPLANVPLRLPWATSPQTLNGRTLCHRCFCDRASHTSGVVLHPLPQVLFVVLAGCPAVGGGGRLQRASSSGQSLPPLQAHPLPISRSVPSAWTEGVVAFSPAAAHSPLCALVSGLKRKCLKRLPLVLRVLNGGSDICFLQFLQFFFQCGQFPAFCPQFFRLSDFSSCT